MLQESIDPTHVRDHNLGQVLKLIHEKRGISRASIVRTTGLSATSVSSIVSELIASGFVFEAGEGESSGGRRPILLKFDPEYKLTMGVDLGASHITTIIANLFGEVKYKRSVKYDTTNNPHQAIALVKEQIIDLMHAEGLQTTDILGIGIAAPAPLEGEHLDRLSPVILPKWKDILIKDEIIQAFDLPVYIDNDANVGAIAEKWWGSGKGNSNFVYIKLGTGVGSGLIVQDEIYRGTGGTAGEIGHTSINENGPQCRCGNFGCMESYVGIQSILAAAHERSAQFPDSVLFQNHKEITIEAITNAAVEQDPLALEIVQSAGRYLGISIANLLNLVNPELVVLGGELVDAGDAFMEAVRLTAFGRSISKAGKEATIKTSELKQDVVGIGAATLVIYFAFLPANIRNTLSLVKRR